MEAPEWVAAGGSDAGGPASSVTTGKRRAVDKSPEARDRTASSHRRDVEVLADIRTNAVVDLDTAGHSHVRLLRLAVAAGAADAAGTSTGSGSARGSGRDLYTPPSRPVAAGAAGAARGGAGGAGGAPHLATRTWSLRVWKGTTPRASSGEERSVHSPLGSPAARRPGSTAGQRPDSASGRRWRAVTDDAGGEGSVGDHGDEEEEGVGARSGEGALLPAEDPFVRLAREREREWRGTTMQLMSGMPDEGRGLLDRYMRLGR